ncbi:MAG: SpoIIIAH-like family protein [Lachnospiraceae bacterium]|jgi:stage III sporulation protein AH|nr:SpoIIIAH-like family protein [Lachnospiraceae bacterium]
MKRILRRNQLIITTLAALIAVAGYLNFTEKNDIARKDKLKDKPVAEAGVNANANESTEKEKSTDDIESNDQDVQSTPGEAIFVNATGTIDFIVEAKLSKEYVRATNSENLNAIIANKDLSTEEKKAAVDKVAEIADISEKEIAAENLIMAKGFKDVVVTMTDGYVDVIIVSKEMDDTTRAQIEDIVKRKLEVSADKITINVIDT